jgi:pSer/pThr/pTyr-binding forkhead associated (FHA) protein
VPWSFIFLQRAKAPLWSPSASPNKLDAERVKALLKTGPHFGVPLEKRPGAETAFADRISVGRAVNKDIVLRDGSVSKFHAWFELDEEVGFYLTDAGSKNLTLVNGVALEPRKRVAVAPGDSSRFGSINACVCEPAELFSALW